MRFIVVYVLLAVCLPSLGEPLTHGDALSEPMCRLQAKQAAKKRYNLCMKRVKQQEMKQLHMRYKKRIENLKKEYEEKLQDLKEEEGSSRPTHVNS